MGGTRTKGLEEVLVDSDELDDDESDELDEEATLGLEVALAEAAAAAAAALGRMGVEAAASAGELGFNHEMAFGRKRTSPTACKAVTLVFCSSSSWLAFALLLSFFLPLLASCSRRRRSSSARRLAASRSSFSMLRSVRRTSDDTKCGKSCLRRSTRWRDSTTSCSSSERIRSCNAWLRSVTYSGDAD